MFTEKDGKQYIIKDGKKQQVFLNEKGEQFFINSKGEPEVILPPSFSIKPPIMKDEDGNEYMLDENGEKLQISLDEFGNKCIMKDGIL